MTEPTNTASQLWNYIVRNCNNNSYALDGLSFNSFEAYFKNYSKEAFPSGKRRSISDDDIQSVIKMNHNPHLYDRFGNVIDVPTIISTKPKLRPPEQSIPSGYVKRLKSEKYFGSTTYSENRGESPSKRLFRESPAPSKRTKLYERDGNKCLKCGETEIKKLTIDHVIPLSKGGSKTNLENLQTLCKKCNAEKGDSIADYRIKMPRGRP